MSDYRGTPASSQIVWLQSRVKELEAKLAAERERADEAEKLSALADEVNKQLTDDLTRVETMNHTLTDKAATLNVELVAARAELAAEREWRKIAGDERKRAIAAEEAVAKLRETNVDLKAEMVRRQHKATELYKKILLDIIIVETRNAKLREALQRARNLMGPDEIIDAVLSETGGE